MHPRKTTPDRQPIRKIKAKDKGLATAPESTEVKEAPEAPEARTESKKVTRDLVKATKATNSSALGDVMKTADAMGVSESAILGNPLSDKEKSRRDELVSVIDEGLATFRLVGSALLEIQSGLLYRETHGNFPDFVGDKWGISGRKAYRLISAANTAELLERAGETDLPKNESQARPLADVPEDQRPVVWSAAKSAAVAQGRDTPVARDVQDAADAVSGRERSSSGASGSSRHALPSAEDDPRLRKAVDAGGVAEGTIIETTFIDEETDGEASADHLLSDDEYLDTIAIRDDLIVNTRRIFDASALAFRSLKSARSAFSHAFSPVMDQANRSAKTIGPYLARWSYALRTGDPSTWKLCVSCNGNGVSPQNMGGGNCTDCRGNGFHLS